MHLQSKMVLPIGVDDFRKLRESRKPSYYVDKTLLIEDFIEFGNFVTLITRPRRFGKTLNMTMIRDFFDITQDSRQIFDGLAIMGSKYANEINTVPVISLSLKGCTGKNVEELIEAVANEVRREYLRYAKVFENADLTEYGYSGYVETLRMFKERKINESDLKNSLAYLLEALYTFYNINPILLIDEYDNPIIEAHTLGFREEFTSFYGAFLTHALKGNPHLGQAMLTGIQRVAKESIFSKLNNIVVYTVLSRHYAPYFGLTAEETRNLLNYYDLELTDKVRFRYDGYLFGGIEMYNPWSILNYANEKVLRNYWLKTSTNALIKEATLEAGIDFHRGFEKLVENSEVEVTINLEASFAELPRTDTLWGLFVNAGYLTVVKEDYGLNSFMVQIPNEEIATEFKEIVGAYTGLSSQLLKDMLLALTSGKMDEFMVIYELLVLESTSFHDAKENSESPAKEALHMLMLGMVMNLRNLYKITSNIERGHGRSDITMESKDAVRPHIIIEFKQGKDLEKLKVEALNQIKERKYYSGLTGEILCVGVAHDRKFCQLVSEVIYG